MVGKIIRMERLSQKIKSKDLAAALGVDTGHLSHIEKGIRNPSKAILAKICKELNLSYQFMLNVSNDSLEEETTLYDVTSHVPYKKVIYTEDFKLIDCPPTVDEDNISLITKMKDDSMEPIIKKGSKLYITYTSFLEDKDYCIFLYNDAILVREFSALKNSIKMSAKNNKYPSVTLDIDDPSLQIIGKVVKYN